jgi:hypothetical protein
MKAAMGLKQKIKSILPKSLLKIALKHRTQNEFKEYKNLSTQQVFDKIYAEGVWDRSAESGKRFFSGSGSHDEEIISAYVQAIQNFVGDLPVKPSFADLGCGDFHVGSQLRELCDTYIACDIVPSLVAVNEQKYKHQNVDFRVLDLANDELPNADVALLRQVLQHLSNDQIRRVVPKLQLAFKYLILTEHLPATDDFEPNIDKPTGPDIRLGFGSGVVLTKQPFGLKPRSEQMLCEVPESGGVIRTTLYTLK